METFNSAVHIVGIVWYRAEDYDAARRIMADGDHLPGLFHVWRLKAEQGEKHLRRAGHTVVRAYIDPETFADWCAARGLNVDAQCRQLFANTVAKEAHGGGH